MMLIYKEKKGIAGKIHKWLYSKALHSLYVEFFTCGAKMERVKYLEQFNLPVIQIAYVPWGISDYSRNYDTTPAKEKYILSAGRSNRDWDFLVSSLKDTEYQIIIVNSEKTPNLPMNYVQYTNIPRNQYYELLSKAYCVLISVDDPSISSVQLALIEALQFNKPVNATDSEGLTKDYLTSGMDGIVIKKDKYELIQALEEIYLNKEAYNKYKIEGRRCYEERFSSKRMGLDIAKLIKEYRGLCDE